MTNSEHYIVQFYSWEYRGRGLHEEDYPVALEPPFMPFIRHLSKSLVIDDGKRPNWLSKLLEGFSTKKKIADEQMPVLDYDFIEAFPSNEISSHHLFKVFIQKEDKKKASQEAIIALLGVLSIARNTISFEVIGNSKQIIIQFTCAQEDVSLVKSAIPAYLHNCLIQYAGIESKKVFSDLNYSNVLSFTLAEEFVRPLKIYNSLETDNLTALLALMDNITDDEQLGIQILFQGCVNSWNDSIVNSVIDSDGKSFFLDAPEAPKLAFEKISYPLFGVSVRIFIQATSKLKGEELLCNASHVLQHATQSSFNKLIPLIEKNVQQAKFDIENRTSHRTGMILNAAELASLVHIPVISTLSKMLLQGTRKTSPVPQIARNNGYILGINHHQLTSSNVSLSIEARLKHMHIIGATGTGKSTLIANIILQDIKDNNGVCLLDPHGDLIDEIIARIPKQRLQDVILVDPTDTEYPIGLNILAAHSDIEKEILASDLVASFRKF